MTDHQNMLIASAIQTPGPLTMSSREIAELTGGTHDNVLKSIRALIDRGVVSGNETPYTHPQNGQTYSEYCLDYRNTMVVVSGYSPELRARIIDRWLELETEAAPPAIALPQNYVEALKALVQSEESKIAIAAERDWAIKTKSWIGTRREAQAMNLASQEVKRVKKLQIQLDRSMEYSTIKRMESLYPRNRFNWRLLKAKSAELNLPAQDVPDANYGNVKAYHADVWRAVYDLAIAPLAVAA